MTQTSSRKGSIEQRVIPFFGNTIFDTLEQTMAPNGAAKEEYRSKTLVVRGTRIPVDSEGVYHLPAGYWKNY